MDNDRWDGDDWFIALFFTAWCWVPALIALVLGALVLGERLAPLFMRLAGEPVRDFVISTIVPHWFDAVLWLAIVACSVRLAIVLAEELTPPVRRLRIRLQWWRLDAAERQRYLAIRKELHDVFRNVKRMMNEAQDKHQ